MAHTRLCYPCLGDVPVLFVNIINARSGRKQLFQMLVDTGASHTAIPASFATSFGHENGAADVSVTQAKGIGGTSLAYLHTLRFELIDPPWTGTVCLDMGENICLEEHLCQAIAMSKASPPSYTFVYNCGTWVAEMLASAMLMYAEDPRCVAY